MSRMFHLSAEDADDGGWQKAAAQSCGSTPAYRKVVSLQKPTKDAKDSGGRVGRASQHDSDRPARMFVLHRGSVYPREILSVFSHLDLDFCAGVPTMILTVLECDNLRGPGGILVRD